MTKVFFYPGKLIACAALCACLYASRQTCAQASPAAESPAQATAVSDGSTAIGPPQRGFFASMSSTLANDSESGWSSVASPSVSYHFNPEISLSTSLPYYVYLNAVKTTKAGATRLIGHEGAIGDASLAGHLHLSPDIFDYTFTAATGFPTGDISLGLSSGQVTWNINNHFERDIAMFTPDLEIGLGNTSSLVRQSARRNYTSVGKLAFFQAGSDVDLPLGMDVEADAYEQLPIGQQTVYTTIVRKKKTVTKLTSTSDADDYGINISYGLPLGKRLGFSSDYSYSIPLEDTSIGFTLSFLLWKPLGR